jgi:hypothetical protein
MPQWQQDYHNNPPPTGATAISEMGQEPPNALRKELAFVSARLSRRNNDHWTRFHLIMCYL